MKQTTIKVLALMMAVITLLTLSACTSKQDTGDSKENGKNEIELTADNYKQYLKLKATVIDSNVEERGYRIFSGDTTIQVEAINQTGAKFKNVSIHYKVIVEDSGGMGYTWKFSPSEKTEVSGSITVSYDGTGSDTKKELKLFKVDERTSVLDPKELDSYNFTIEIDSIYGTVVAE